MKHWARLVPAALCVMSSACRSQTEPVDAKNKGCVGGQRGRAVSLNQRALGLDLPTLFDGIETRRIFRVTFDRPLGSSENSSSAGSPHAADSVEDFVELQFSVDRRGTRIFEAAERPCVERVEIHGIWRVKTSSDLLDEEMPAQGVIERDGGISLRASVGAQSVKGAIVRRLNIPEVSMIRFAQRQSLDAGWVDAITEEGADSQSVSHRSFRVLSWANKTDASAP